MTKSVKSFEHWRKLHLVFVKTLALAWASLVVGFLLVPGMETTTTRGIILGTGSMLPHIWLGQRLWHDPKRTGIGIPIAILSIRFIGSLILFSVFLWQFPLERQMVSWTGSGLIIVSTIIEAFLFAKGVGRL